MPTAVYSERLAVHSEHLARQLITISAAAEYLGVADKTIRRRISDGSLTAYRMGSRLIRLDADEVDGLLRPVPTAGGDHA